MELKVINKDLQKEFESKINVRKQAVTEGVQCSGLKKNQVKWK